MTHIITSDDIDLHIRTYRSLLRASHQLKISQLIDSHCSMHSVLHTHAQEKTVDTSALIYAILRLPTCVWHIQEVVLAQSFSVFSANGYGMIDSWTRVTAPGRRRKMFWNNNGTVAMYIVSVTDVDDVVTLLTAFQIEWNKLHDALKKQSWKKVLGPLAAKKLQDSLGGDFKPFIGLVQKERLDITVKLLSGSYSEYAKATRLWWRNIVSQLSDLSLENRPIYFVSSNTHSVVNVLTRFVLSEEKRLIEFLETLHNKELSSLWRKIQQGSFLASREYFLYYLAKKYAAVDPTILDRRNQLETKYGIHYLPSSHFLDVNVQIVELAKLSHAVLDERLEVNVKQLATSDALIVNIDYPLGWSAYQILSELAETVDSIQGVYIMGKAATLNGMIGDILIPHTVLDQHTHNTFVFSNAFSASDFTNLFTNHAILDNQKLVSAKGTFLENMELMKEWYKEGYTIVEMEAGPYLNACFEMLGYTRYPDASFVNVTKTPFELGIVNYASDTPTSKATNLGVRNLSYDGVEATYAISLAIIKKIILRETARLGNRG